MVNRRLLLSVSFDAALTVAPVEIQPLSLAGPGHGPLLRIQSACGQALECTPQRGYICSGPKADKLDHTFSKGCGGNES